MSDHAKRHDLQTLFLDALVVAAKQRKTKSKLVRLSGGRTEVAWVLFERDTMYQIVTEQRAKLGKEPLPIAEIERVECMSLGHSDYGHKYAIYCTELVFDRA